MTEAPPGLSPDYIADAKNFQRIFADYFPRLVDDFEQSGYEMEWLYCRVFGNPKETVRRAQAKADLEKVAKALRVLIEHPMPYWQHVHWIVRSADQSGDQILQWEHDIFHFIMDLSKLHDEGMTNAVIDKFVGDAREGIDRLPETANVKWEAVHAIDALRVLWWRNTGKDAPSRALNPASQFSRFLIDGFAFLDISADPASAFRRWAARSEVV